MTPVKVDDVPRRTHKAMRVGGMVTSMFIERATPISPKPRSYT